MQPRRTSSFHTSTLSPPHTQALQAEVARLRAECDGLRRRLAAQGAAHAAELAAVMEDAAVHELAAVEKAVYEERLRWVAVMCWCVLRWLGA